LFCVLFKWTLPLVWVINLKNKIQLKKVEEDSQNRFSAQVLKNTES